MQNIQIHKARLFFLVYSHNIYIKNQLYVPKTNIKSAKRVRFGQTRLSFRKQNKATT